VGAPVVQEVILLRVHGPENDTLFKQMPDLKITQWPSRMGEVHGVSTSKNSKLISLVTSNTNGQTFFKFQ
jgi:hypothetical protein